MKDEDNQKKAINMINRLLVYKDMEIREGAFADLIKEIPVDKLAGLIMYVITMADRKEERFLRVVNIFTNKSLIKNAVGEKGFYRMLTIAREKGYREVILTLLENITDIKNREIDEPLQDYRTEGLTLGERKSLSKSLNHDIIERLLYDSNPLVIRGLLSNPKILESDVLKIVSKKPNSANILKTVYNSSKWISRYRIECSIAMNPYTPVELTIAILPHILMPDLMLIANDSKLPEIIREKAGNMIKSLKKELA